jgi:mannosyl-3-phosphoglycerate phosphatase
MAEIVAQYRPRRTLALGDAPNDIEMLEAADRGVIVANPHGTPLAPLPGEADGRISRTSKPGPEGWNAAVCAVLSGLGA